MESVKKKDANDNMAVCLFCGQRARLCIVPGFGYIAVVIKCSYCRKTELLYYEEDKSLDMNADRQFYEY